MGWEQRNGNWYYYRKMRRGRQVVSEYFGAGPSAGIFAELDQMDRDEKMFARDEWKGQKADLDQIEMQAERSSLLIRGIVRAHFLLAGYHPHKGQLRKRRDER
jgi:hypothetical protein